jgi:multiple sugar transport system ATP-binding protein
MASVEYINVTKCFDNRAEALVDFNLKVKDGELMVLVGPSGCGKSTALRLLAGLETVTSGELLIDDTTVNEATPQQRNIAMVFQNYALYPHMTVQHNLDFPLRMMKLSSNEIDKRIRWAADLLKLTEVLGRKPNQLSGGQRQRVAMGRAIVREPKVFLMDEPLSNLDAKLRVQIRTEIAALQRRLDITTLYVTHDQVEAMTLGDRVAVINSGRLQQVDNPQKLYEHPANIFVAQFIGSPGMNILASRLQKGDKGLVVEFAGQWLELTDNSRSSFDRLSQYLEQPIYIGLRPEAISLADAAEAEVSLALKTIEALGHEQLLYFEFAEAKEQSLVVRTQGTRSYSIADQVPLTINSQELYFFNQQGEAIY